MSGSRVLASVATGLVLFVVTLALGGAADAEADDAGPMRVAMPGPGASATYAALDETGARVATVTMTWQTEPAVVTDQRYDERLAWVLELEADVGDGSTHRAWAYYDAATGAGLFDGKLKAQAGGVSGACVCGGDPQVGLEQATSQELAFDIYDDQRGPCGVWGPAHGRPVEELARSDALVVPGTCLGWGGTETTAMVRTGSLDGVAFASEDGRATVVYDEHALPVRTALPVPHTFWYFPAQSSWTLVRESVQDAAPYRMVADSLVAAGPGLPETAPRTPWTLDDGDMEHPFPLRDAYQAVLDTPHAPSVPLFLAQHPDAYLAQAWARDHVDGGGRIHHAWTLTWSDGTDTISKLVYDRPAGAAGLGDEETRVIEVKDHTTAQTFLPPDALPDELPRPAAVMARYRELEQTPDASAPQRYGFGLYCSGDCTRPFIQVAAGHYLSTTGDPVHQGTAATEGHETTYRQLMVHADGRAMFTELGVYRESAPLSELDPEPSTAAPPRSAWRPEPVTVAGAGLAALAAVLVYFAPLLKHAAGVRLFSRIHGEEVLAHPMRADILERVRAEPGIHFQGLARACGVGRGTLDHHLQKLLDAGYLTAHRTPGYVCYFPKGRVDRAAMAAAPLLKAAGSRRVLEELRSRPGITGRELAAAVGMAPSSAHYHIKRLRDAGLVLGLREGNGTRLHVTPQGEAALSVTAR